MSKKYTFEQVSNMEIYKDLSFEEKQIMYVLENADRPLTEEEIILGVAELVSELKLN